MEKPADLSIILATPPWGAPPEVIADIALQCEALGLNHTGAILLDPLAQQERNDLSWYLEEYWKWPYLEFAERGKQVEALLYEVGKRLYHTVFGGSEAQALIQKWQNQSGTWHQISILSEIPAVLSLPWELLHDGHGFLALHPRHPISIIRRLPQHEQAVLSTSFEPPLRILLVTSRPEGVGFIDPRTIARELVDEMQAQVEVGSTEIEFLRPPTLAALRIRLKDTKRPIHVLHFDGHGAFDEEKVGQGVLLFENEAGRHSVVKASDLAKVLQDSGVRLVVLTACQSAMSAPNDPFSSVAAQLIRSGVDAVVAMSASILVVSATYYVETFYGALARGTPTPLAQEQARRALYDDPRRHLFHRHLDEEKKPVELSDWWLPHFYQQRPVLLQPTGTVQGRKQSRHPLPTRRLSEQMPEIPRYGFHGRARELHQIERSLMRGRVVIIHGFGGVGKTALAREIADWLTRTRMYNGACFVSFEFGGDATLLLRVLGNYLEIYDENYDPNDRISVLERLKPLLKEQRILMIADGLESVLPGGHAPLEASAQTEVWDILLELAQMGAGVLLTSQNVVFGGERLITEKRAVFLELGGLHPEDSYAFATHLLDDLGIDRQYAPYVELRDLLEQLDHLPLAIQLVLPTLQEMPLSQIKAEFTTLLPKFVDNTMAGRHRSLVASLNYSLRRLSREQQALLPLLSVFEGGTSEDDLLAITEIPNKEWTRLCLSLEQAALLTKVKVHEIFTFPFLHFHPMLVPFLRSQLGAENTALRERHTQHYLGLMSYFRREDSRRPEPVRLLVQRELPNLRQALEFLQATDNQEAASYMAESLAWFLNKLGLWQERDQLRRQVVATIARGTHVGGVLEEEEYLREFKLGEDELGKGNFYAASVRFTNLLVRIEVLPEGMPLGRGSLEHYLTLFNLARSLHRVGQPVAAEKRLREVLTRIDTRVKQQPDDQTFVNLRGVLLTDLSEVLCDQGRYTEARTVSEEGLKVAVQLGNRRQQAVVQSQLGRLAFEQGEYPEARKYYLTVLSRFQTFIEPEVQAGIWHNLGLIAMEQEEWAEAERCFRESLTLGEQLGDKVGAAEACNQLANIAEKTTRATEAEGWYKRTLEFDEHIHPGSPSHAIHSGNFAAFQVNEVQAGRSPKTRLSEARVYAERALAIQETLGDASHIANTLKILTVIAELEGLTAVAKGYRRREREAYAAFAGNRSHIERIAGPNISLITAAARGNMRARSVVEAALPETEASGWHITAAIQRIWAGERDWHLLTEDLDGEPALLILRVLERLAQSTDTSLSREEDKSPEQFMIPSPTAISNVVERSHVTYFEQAFEAISIEEQRASDPSRLSEKMPSEPRYGFCGRGRELLQIEHWLRERKLVVVHGSAGVGKTALVRETADQLTRKKMYDGACFVSFEHGGDVAMLLSTLGAYLNAYDDQYNANESRTALTLLDPALKEKHTLVIADNVESILPDGGAPLDEAVRRQLWDILLEWTAMGVGVLLTSRSASFDDGRLTSAGRVVHLALGGLHPDDAEVMVGRLMSDLEIDQSRAPRTELQDFLVQLDHHPLAIQLVLPVLRELPLSIIKDHFAELLPLFVDETATGSHRSLSTLLDTSLHLLKDEQRALLPRLVLFEAGANERELLAITEISQAEWAKLRLALEQAGLLRAEYGHEMLVDPFLRFHPLLIPFLSSMYGIDNLPLREAYTLCYFLLVRYLYFEDNSRPLPIRAVARQNLPNLRHALDLLLEMGYLGPATEMVGYITRFLEHFGLRDECDILQKRVAEAVATRGAQGAGALTRQEWQLESNRGSTEFHKGDIRAAYNRFMSLLTRIEALPEGHALGRGSYQHCYTLDMLARCLREAGQITAAEERIREALRVIDSLIQQQPDNQGNMRERNVLLENLGIVLHWQGQYQQAQELYEEALKIARELGDPGEQAVALGQLGSLARDQQDYDRARSYLSASLDIFHTLGDSLREAAGWYNLGQVAQKENEWAESEHYYRRSLLLYEQQGDTKVAAQICGQLAFLAKTTGSPNQAEYWFKRALELDERVHPGSSLHADHLTNFAALLVQEVKEGRSSMERLVEAEKLTEQALAIKETLDTSQAIWTTLEIRAQIADLQGRAKEAKDYRRRERETFAAVVGNSSHIDRSFRQFILAIAAAAKGDVQIQTEVEAALPEIEAKGWHISSAVQRIWKGERDWQSLGEELSREEALIILRVLEALLMTPEQIISYLPEVIQAALEQGNEDALKQEFEVLSSEEQKVVATSLRYLQAQSQEEINKPGEKQE